jgi:amidophosphoribosyltransferase
MGGLFGVVLKDNCLDDLFYGIDYHSHLGTTIGGLAVLSDRITEPIYHDISNSQFKTEFKEDFEKLKGNLGIGIISSIENDKQPIVFRSKLGTFALCTDGTILNADALISELVEDGVSFREFTTGFNLTELVGEMICKGASITDGIAKMYDKIDGTVSLLLLSEDERRIYAAGGVFPLIAGKKTTSQGYNLAIASETTAFYNLNYEIHKYPRYKDIISIDEDGMKTNMESREKIMFCPFLHVYFDFPTSSHYGINGEIVRERCGTFLAKDDTVTSTLIMGVADSGIPHGHGYAKGRIELAKKKSLEALSLLDQGDMDATNFKSILTENLEMIAPLRRSVIKFTAGWGRSYIPPQQSTRDMIAYYKQVANPGLISNQSIVLVDDSIRRGTQLYRYLKDKIWPNKPKAVHARIASPPQLFACYFDQTTNDSDLIARKAVKNIEEGEPKDLSEYLDVSTQKYEKMVILINESIGATSLKYISLDDMVKAIIKAPGNTILKEENLCKYCWTGKKPI